MTSGIVLTPELTGVDANDLTNQANAAAVAFYGPDVPVHISWAGAATMTRTGAAYKFTAMAIIHAVEDQTERINEIHHAAQKAGIPSALIDAIFGSRKPADGDDSQRGTPVSKATSADGRGKTDGWPDSDDDDPHADAARAREGYSRRRYPM
jgi:hypothetical protein